MGGPVGPGSDPVPTPRLRAARLSEAERDADVWARTVIEGRLARMRELATQWGATVAALTALFGTGTVIDADDAVRSLDPPFWGYLYGGLSATALAFAGWSIYKAASAAEAQVRSIPPGAPERLRLLDELVTNSASRLRTSRIIALLAVAVLIVSLAVRWYAPVKPELAPQPGAGVSVVVAVSSDESRNSRWSQLQL